MVLADEVPAEVAAVVGAVRAVRAEEGRLLAALHLEVLAQVPLPAVHVAALVAGELAGVGGRGRGRHQRTGWQKHLVVRAPPPCRQNDSG